jgi:hypothetical protein
MFHGQMERGMSPIAISLIAIHFFLELGTSLCMLSTGPQELRRLASPQAK